MVNDLAARAQEEKDEGMISILKKIFEIPKEVKGYVIHKYMNQCNRRFLIAFVEWRLYYSQIRRECTHNYKLFDGELEDIVSDESDWMYRKY